MHFALVRVLLLAAFPVEKLRLHVEVAQLKNQLRPNSRLLPLDWLYTFFFKKDASTIQPRSRTGLLVTDLSPTRL